VNYASLHGDGKGGQSTPDLYTESFRALVFHDAMKEQQLKQTKVLVYTVEPLLKDTPEMRMPP